MNGWSSSSSEFPPFTEEGLESVMSLANLLSSGSNCVRRKVGAVLIASDMTVRGVGFNFVATEGSDCRSRCPRAQASYEDVPARSDYRAKAGRCYSVHAEVNALEGFVGKCHGWWMVTTYQPCPDCQRLLDSVGVVAIWRDQ